MNRFNNKNFFYKTIFQRPVKFKKTGVLLFYLYYIKKWVNFNQLLVTFFFYFAISGIAFTKSDSPYYIYNIISDFDSVFTQKIKENNIPGAAYAIVSNGKEVMMKCYGVRNIQNPESVNEHTLFRLASLSKGMSAVLTGILVENHVLNWDDPVTKYLPDFYLQDPIATQNLTIRHLLSHTSGLPSYAGTEMLENNLPHTLLIPSLAKVPLQSQPGEQYNYQNVLFSLIGDIIETVMATGYGQAIETNLFIPLGMNDACVGRQELLENSNHASPHIMQDSIPVPVEIKQSYYNIPPAAGINASIADMIQWVKIMLGYRPDIISPAILEQITMPYIKTDKESRYFGDWLNLNDTFYGLGWRVFNYAGTNLIYHGGYVQGFRSEIALDPKNNLGIVFLMNSETSFADYCVPLFFDHYLRLIDHQ
ncbi:beta-lactamase family protein [candidate division KSB1 bacterium]|nr:beta-lactamase family protein [candidate division KSB1 bacterium]